MKTPRFLSYAAVMAISAFCLLGCTQEKEPEKTGEVGSSAQDIAEQQGNADSIAQQGKKDGGNSGPGTDAQNPDPAAKTTQYFIAVHCDPNAVFPDEFIQLDTMVQGADERGLKLTLMFTPQWADFIVDAAPRKAKVEAWANHGHEIAMHHHSVYHQGTWDQYTDLEFDEYSKIMGMAKAGQQEKLGNLDDLTEILENFYPGIDAGCANDEQDKRAMPDSVLKDTCSGFYTTYAHPVGTRNEGGDPLMGVNDFVLVGKTANGIERRWLGHGLISSQFIDGSEAALKAMVGGAHGAIVHTRDQDLTSLIDWMDRLVSYDGGAGTGTLSSIIDSGALPEETIDDAVLNQVYESEGKDKDGGPPGAGDGPPGAKNP